MTPRFAEASEIDPLVELWFHGWRDAHASIVPPELTRLRTRDSFLIRLRDAVPLVRVIGAPGYPLGFHWLRGDELHQLYVAAAARGSGVAAALIADAEARLAESGVETAWLGCAIGNERAARFYEKSGWHRASVVRELLQTSVGTFPLEVWRYEKVLSRS
jgi:GNAT superfamily N-acetyltransferase